MVKVEADVKTGWQKLVTYLYDHGTDLAGYVTIVAAIKKFI